MNFTWLNKAVCVSSEDVFLRSIIGWSFEVGLFSRSAILRLPLQRRLYSILL